MPPLHRCVPALRQIRTANTTFRLASATRAALTATPPIQRRWQHAQAQEQDQRQEATTSATSEGNHEHDPKADSPKATRVKYTSESYNLKRDSKYTELTAEHVKWFKELLGTESAVLDGVTRDATDEIEAYNADWMRKYRGHAKLVVKPGSTSEVSQILKYCNDNMLAVVPQFLVLSEPLLPQYLLIGATLSFTDFVVMAGYTALAAKVLTALKEVSHVRAMNRVFGAFFVLAGTLLALFKRSA